MATVAEQIQKVYIGLLGRAADKAGLDYWTNEIESGALTLEQLRANIVEEQPEYQNGIGQMTRAQAVNQLYQNLFNRSAEDEGLDYWVNGGGADVSFDQLVLALVDGASAADTLALDNKAQVAQYYTAQSGANYDESGARSAIDGVDGDTDLADARADVDDSLSGEGSNLELTQRADNLTGTDGNDVFTAPVTQDETGSGAVANTFETGDVLDGGEGRDVLNADLTASLSGSVPIAPTISATTESIEVVNLRAQYPNLADTTIDAERMSGVEEWWSDNSRSGILVEDIRSNPDDTAFGMRDTDPGVSFASYFNANFLEGGAVVGASAFNFTIRELNAASDELKDITVNGIRFELNGERYQLDGADVEAANTWAELQAALQAEINATEGLENLTVAHRGNGQFVVTDPQSGDFVVDPAGTVISSSTTNEVKDASLGVPQITDLPTETDIRLDGAGNGSQGGALDVGVMSGNRGVEVFNTTVESDSHVSAMLSSNLRTGDQYLQEVLVDGEGDLTIGNTTGTFEGRALNGLVDVRVLDASELDGSLNAGVTLTANTSGRYLNEAEEPVNFEYTGTANDDTLSINVDPGVAGDPDFAMQVDGGAGDDLISLTNNFALSGVSIEGGEGEDTLETASNIGVNAASTPVDFANIEHLMLTGTNTSADMAALAGVDSVTIATGSSEPNVPGGNSTVTNLEAGTDLEISGERQTQGNDSNANQNFGTITLTNAQSQSQLVELGNTARVDGQLSVAGLTVDGNNSAVRELTLESGGRRDTSNTVNNISAALVTDLAFTGSQALAAEVDLMGQNANGVAQAFDVSGAELGGPLSLDIEADLITASNARNQSVSLTASEAGSDRLTLDGNATAQDITTDTTATGFETVVLDNFAGNLDATNFNGVDTYEVDSLAAATTVTNLSAGEEVVLSDGGAQNADLTLEGPGSGDIKVTLEDTADNGLAWGANQLAINGYADVNLVVEHSFAEATNLDLLLDNYGVNNLNEVDGDVDNLVITGGNANGADSLTLTSVIPASVETIDVTGFNGAFTASLGNAVDSTTASVNSDVTFKLDGNDVDIALIDDDADPTTLVDATGLDFNAIFEFSSAGTAADPSIWVIDNFVTQNNATGANTNNFSKLDLTALGIESYTDLDMVDGGDANGDGDTGVVITAENGSTTWMIELTGVAQADLGEEYNFA